MRAGLALLGQAAPQGRGRRIAVLGDMLELATSPKRCTGASSSRSRKPGRTSSSWRADDGAALAGLADQRRGAYCETAAPLEQILVEAIGPGDVVMVKASAGTKLGPVVEGLKRRFPPRRNERGRSQELPAC
jgi:UDP-N-acetylmuramyl pentapeptide synthase